MAKNPSPSPLTLGNIMQNTACEACPLGVTWLTGSAVIRSRSPNLKRFLISIGTEGFVCADFKLAAAGWDAINLYSSETEMSA